MFSSRALQGANKHLTQLTSKRGGRHFYKGRGAPTMGYKIRSRFHVLPHKVAMHSIKVPDLTGFKLRAYVAHDTPKILVRGVTGVGAVSSTE